MALKRPTIFAIVTAFVLVGGSAVVSIQRPHMPGMFGGGTALAGTAEQFQFLNDRTSNSCGGGKAVVHEVPEDGRLQGSCCGPMDMHSYQEQVEGLQAKYGEYDIIPPDPYDVSVAWAQDMIEYGDRIALTTEQQAVYDEAVALSEEGGPCCCVCWHWYAYEGLAKHLIINEQFTAEQIAGVWDLSDACGGDHHHHGL